MLVYLTIDAVRSLASIQMHPFIELCAKVTREWLRTLGLELKPVWTRETAVGSDTTRTRFKFYFGPSLVNESLRQD